MNINKPSVIPILYILYSIYCIYILYRYLSANFLGPSVPNVESALVVVI